MITIFISNMLGMLILSVYGQDKFNYRFQFYTNFIIATLLSIISTISFLHSPPFKILITFVIYLFFFIGIFENNIKSKLYYFLPFPIFISLSEIITINILNILNTYFYIPESTLMYIGILFSNVLTYFLLLLMNKFYDDSIKIKSRFIMLGFFSPFITFLLIIYLIEFTDFININTFFNLTIIALLISTIITYYTIFKIIKLRNIQEDYILSKKNEEVLKLENELQEYQYNMKFESLHQIIHLSSKLEMLYNLNMHDEVLKSIREVANIANYELNILHTNSDILNKILYKFIDVIKKEDIKISVSMLHTDFSCLNINDQNTLFNNLIEYAISVNLEFDSKKKFIILKTNKINNNQITVQLQTPFRIKPDNKIKKLKDELYKVAQKFNVIIHEINLNKNNVNSIMIILELE